MKSSFTVAAALGFLFLIVPSIFEIGKWVEGHNYTVNTVIQGAILMVLFFVLGYGAGKSSSRK